MSLKMFDVEIDEVEFEDVARVDCKSDALIEIAETDVVEVIALDEEETADLSAPLYSFWDCPPLALAGILGAMISFTGVVLFYGLIVALTFRLPPFP